MKHHVFSGGLDNDNITAIQELFTAISDCESGLVIYLDSNGGFVAWADLIIRALNDKKNLITLIGGPDMSSAALVIWLAFKGAKDVAIGISAVAHMSRSVSPLRDGKALECYDPKEDSVTIAKFSTPPIKTLLTEKQFRDYKLGLDVLIPYNQLKKYAIAHNKTL